MNARFRDISFEELKKCFTKLGLSKFPPDANERWEKLRGKAISIQKAPLSNEQWEFYKCEGPFHVSFEPYKAQCVCIHNCDLGKKESK